MQIVSNLTGSGGLCEESFIYEDLELIEHNDAFLHDLVQVRVVLTLGNVEQETAEIELENTIIAIKKSHSNGAVFDTLIDQMPFLTTSICESLLQAFLLLDTPQNKLYCLLLIIEIGFKQNKKMEPICEKMVRISISLIAKIAVKNEVEAKMIEETIQKL